MVLDLKIKSITTTQIELMIPITGEVELFIETDEYNSTEYYTNRNFIFTNVTNGVIDIPEYVISIINVFFDIDEHNKRIGNELIHLMRHDPCSERINVLINDIELIGRMIDNDNKWANGFIDHVKSHCIRS